jgi:glutamate--cysteine ligase catalytic subunit
LTANIRERRGSKVNIRIPLFQVQSAARRVRRGASSRRVRTCGLSDAQDKNTDMSDPVIHMDAMGFGMGCCCLQVRRSPAAAL